MTAEYLQRSRFHNLSGKYIQRFPFQTNVIVVHPVRLWDPQEKLIIKEWDRKQNQNILSIGLVLELESLSAVDPDHTAKCKSNHRFWDLSLEFGVFWQPSFVFFSFVSQVLFSFVFQVMCTVTCNILQWLNELEGWAVCSLLCFSKGISQVYHTSWLFSFFFFFFNSDSEGLICYFLYNILRPLHSLHVINCSIILPCFPPPANRLSSCHALCFGFSHCWCVRKACSNQAGHSFNQYLTVNCKPAPWSSATIPCLAAKPLISTYCFWKDYNLCTRLPWSDVHKNIKYENKIALSSACEPKKPLYCCVRYASNHCNSAGQGLWENGNFQPGSWISGWEGRDEMERGHRMWGTPHIFLRIFFTPNKDLSSPPVV